MKKKIISSFIGLGMLSDLAQAHQFTATELTVLNNTSSLFQTIMIKTTSPLTRNDKDAIYHDGIESIVYAGDMSSKVS